MSGDSSRMHWEGVEEHADGPESNRTNSIAINTCVDPVEDAGHSHKERRPQGPNVIRQQLHILRGERNRQVRPDARVYKPKRMSKSKAETATYLQLEQRICLPKHGHGCHLRNHGIMNQTDGGRREERFLSPASVAGGPAPHSPLASSQWKILRRSSSPRPRGQRCAPEAGTTSNCPPW